MSALKKRWVPSLSTAWYFGVQAS